MKNQLAPVYVNDARVTLQGDPMPQVAKIVQATGRRPRAVQVVRLAHQGDPSGEALALEDTIDRTRATGPVYLRCFSSGNPIWDRSGRPSRRGAPNSPAGAPGMGVPSAGRSLVEGRIDTGLGAPEEAHIDTVSGRRHAGEHKDEPHPVPNGFGAHPPPTGPLTPVGPGEAELEPNEALASPRVEGGAEAREGGEVRDLAAGGPGPAPDGQDASQGGEGGRVWADAADASTPARSRRRAESAEREAQEDGTQRPPPS